MKITGEISTYHENAECTAKALDIDNLSSMSTKVCDSSVVFSIKSEKLRSVIAAVDDYLMNLSIAQEMCEIKEKL